MKKMTKAQLVKLSSQIAKLEGKKSQVSVGNIREVLSIVYKVLAAQGYEITKKEVI